MHCPILAVQRRAGGLSVADFAAAHAGDRRAAMAAAHLDGGHTLAAVARHFGVHYSTVSRAVAAARGGDVWLANG